MVTHDFGGVEKQSTNEATKIAAIVFSLVAIVFVGKVMSDQCKEDKQKVDTDPKQTQLE
jgi:hypothetical protein